MRTRKMQILMKMGRSMTIEAEPREKAACFLRHRCDSELKELEDKYQTLRCFLLFSPF
ncbi:unnamed protein product [Linum tenue]|uniref:Uncharacterized protein n=1 Tax=Linum tenue TaxID=586396 RepID=A0AAV0IF04_9ROSI|nr:unnamed protein product [Linum tenue]